MAHTCFSPSSPSTSSTGQWQGSSKQVLLLLIVSSSRVRQNLASKEGLFISIPAGLLHRSPRRPLLRVVLPLLHQGLHQPEERGQGCSFYLSLQTQQAPIFTVIDIQMTQRLALLPGAATGCLKASLSLTKAVVECGLPSLQFCFPNYFQRVQSNTPAC